MKQEIEILTFEEVTNKIAYLRNLGKIEEAIEVCKVVADASPSTYFYPKIEGDLYFQKRSIWKYDVRRTPPRG